MKLRRIPRIVFICLAALLALGSGGIVFAGFTHTLEVTGIAQACQGGTVVYSYDYTNFIWAVSNDNARLENQGSYYPIDTGDNGLDPAGSLIPYQPPAAQPAGQTCSRYDKNVAATSAAVEFDNRYIKVLINNAYPYYHPTVFFGLHNGHSAAGKVNSILVTNADSDDMTVRLNGVSLGQRIESGEDVNGSLDIQIEQAASQAWTYFFTVKIGITGVESTVYEQDEEGTPGFWCNNWSHFYCQSDLLRWLKEIDCSSKWIEDPTGRSWTVDDMYCILNAGTGRQATDRTRFLRHYLVTRLNICAGRLNEGNPHSITAIDGYQKLGVKKPWSVALNQIVNTIEGKYNLSKPGDPLFNIMKNVCDNINNLRI